MIRLLLGADGTIFGLGGGYYVGGYAPPTQATSTKPNLETSSTPTPSS